MMEELTPEMADRILREQLRDFNDFAEAIIAGTIPEFAPPFDGYLTGEGDIISYLTPFFKSYLQHVKNIGCLDYVNITMNHIVNHFREENGDTTPAPEFDLYEETSAVCNMILRCLGQYFKGFTGWAFEEMEKAMTAPDKSGGEPCHLLQMLPQIHKEKGSFWMYRVRRGSYSDVKDLFHVPFELRKYCSTYRFSIAGLPALYCSTTLNTAILETGIELSEEVSAARYSFKPDYDFSFVDLTIPMRVDYGFWENYSMVLFYPLIVACGLKVKDPKAPFKQEYIIPQLFYQLMRTHSSDFDGIIYNSTKHANRKIADHRQNALVLFTENCDQEKGYCSTLADKLEVAGPITFRYDSEADIEKAGKRLRNICEKDVKA